ncbi:MAG: hypothetical protein WBB94_03640 [Candidatus Saccharimonadaceae bacterium]
MNKRIKLTISTLAIIVSIVAVGTATVRAEENATTDTETETISENKTTTRENLQKAAEERKQKAAEAKERAKTKLDSAKLKVCENREAKIEKTMTNLQKRGENQIAVFDKIYERLKKFYADKGYSVANYSALIADVEAKKLVAQTAISEIAAMDKDIKCASDNPKATAEAFRTKMKDLITKLKEYRTSIKNMIVAIKSAQSTATKTEETN